MLRGRFSIVIKAVREVETNDAAQRETVEKAEYEMKLSRRHGLAAYASWTNCGSGISVTGRA